MRKRTATAIIVCLIITFRLEAFPVYNVGIGFSGLTRNNGKIESHIQYTQTKNSEVTKIRQDSTEVKKKKEYKVLWQSNDPYYLKYSSNDGSVTFWNNTELQTTVSGDIRQEALAAEGINGEYQVMPIDVTNEGVLLFDYDRFQYVFHLDNGNSVSIPQDISEYRIVKYIHYKLGEKPKQWVFVQYDSGLDFSMAVLNHDGSVSMKLRCNQPVTRINRIYCHLPAERFLVDYSDERGKRGLLIVSNAGTVIKNLSNYHPGNEIAFYENATQYVTTRNEFSSRHVIDMNDGEIKAELILDHIDLAIANGSLLAIVSSGRHVGVVDPLNGVLIQNFSDFNRDIRIGWVRFQNKGNEVMIAERSPGKPTSTIRHFQAR